MAAQAAHVVSVCLCSLTPPSSGLQDMAAQVAAKLEQVIAANDTDTLNQGLAIISQARAWHAALLHPVTSS